MEAENTQIVAAPVAIHDDVASIMAVIERCALNPDVDIDKMQKLLDMQERILNRNASQAFAAALARMQADLPEITEKGQIKIGNEVRSKYGLFEDINQQVRPVLKKHGFAISFRVSQTEKLIKVTAILSHEQGHTESTELDLPVDSSGSKNAVQAVGSSVSYGKRYTMCALLNITTRGEDDDGRAADQTATEAQQSAIVQLVMKLPDDRRKKFGEAYPDIKQIKKSEVNTVIAQLKRAGGANA